MIRAVLATLFVTKLEKKVMFNFPFSCTSFTVNVSQQYNRNTNPTKFKSMNISYIHKQIIKTLLETSELQTKHYLLAMEIIPTIHLFGLLKIPNNASSRPIQRCTVDYQARWGGPLPILAGMCVSCQTTFFGMGWTSFVTTQIIRPHSMLLLCVGLQF